MYEVRFHGRGGQGAVTAAAMLAAALLEEGKYAVSIPSFGFERRGAPVVELPALQRREIRQMTNIYRPDCLICVDPTLTPLGRYLRGLKPGGTWCRPPTSRWPRCRCPTGRHRRPVRRGRHRPGNLQAADHQHPDARRLRQDHRRCVARLRCKRRWRIRISATPASSRTCWRWSAATTRPTVHAIEKRVPHERQPAIRCSISSGQRAGRPVSGRHRR
jgi:hypothetical protein